MLRLTCVAAILVALSAPAAAHSGRRLSVEVVAGKLQAQGVNTGPDDGAPAVRPYTNSIHDHWTNVAEFGLATASLPGFDIGPAASTALADHRLDLTLHGVLKWVSPPAMPGPTHTPRLQRFGDDKLLAVNGPIGTVDSQSLGTLTLAESIPFGGVSDIDLNYVVNDLPTDEIHLLEFQLSAHPNDGGPGKVAASDPVYILLSPDGATPAARLHHASLFLERYVTTIPEPSTTTLLTLGYALLIALGKRTRGAGHPQRRAPLG